LQDVQAYNESPPCNQHKTELSSDMQQRRYLDDSWQMIDQELADWGRAEVPKAQRHFVQKQTQGPISQLLQ